MKGSVKDYMVPVAEFPLIAETATLAEGVLALDKVHEEYLAGRREQRILLVCDSGNKVVGKLSPIDVMRGLEPDYDKVMDGSTSPLMGNVGYVIDSMKNTATLWAKPLDDMCVTAQGVAIRDVVSRPTKSQVIGQDDSINTAFHRFVMFRHDSLFVMDGKKLVGLLRFSDVYREVADKMKNICSV